MRHIILIPNIRVQNANALSSPYTIGFPAMTAWLGAVHALQRHISQYEKYHDIKFISMAVVCHKMDLQIHKSKEDPVYSIKGTRNPFKSDGKPSSFIEEARCHLEVSLVIEYKYSGSAKNIVGKEQQKFLSALSNVLHSKMKLASGDILSFKAPSFLKIDENNDQELRSLSAKLMPGYLLVERRQLIIEAMQEEEAKHTSLTEFPEGCRPKDAIDVMLDYLKVTHRKETDENGKVTEKRNRKISGWILPIATGFRGISPLSKARNQRDTEEFARHRFAESVITLGEFKLPTIITSLDDMLWHYYYDAKNSLYICQQNNHVNNI